MNSSPSKNTQLARLARERFVGEICGDLRGIAQAVLAAVAAPAKTSGGAKSALERQTALFGFQGVQAAWVAGAGKALQKQLKPIDAPESNLMGLGRASGSGALAFTLMDEGQIENKILASRLALGLSDEASQELNDLRQRIQSLEGGAELASQDVIKPDTVATALVEQWMTCGLSRESWALLATDFRAPLGQSLLEAYHHANEFLLGQGVLPEIDRRPIVKRSTSDAGHTSAASASAEAAAETMAGGGGGGGQSGQAGGQATQTGGVLQRDGSSHETQPSSLAAQETRMLTNVSPLTKARDRAQGVIGQLRQLLTDQVADYQATRPMVASPGLAQALRQAPPVFPATSKIGLGHDESAVAELSQELNRHSTELKKSAATASEKATIEIVALMFQSILAEERISAGVRVWFARLQMPVLREAVAEPQFFNSLTHPARQLIDQMGSVALGFDAHAVDGKAMEAEIRRIVQTIEQYPETGQRVFALMHEEFQQFLARFLTEGAPTQKVLSVARQVEEKETLVIQYIIELRKQLKLTPAPHEIREFLFKIWAEVEAVATIRFGATDSQTLALKSNVAELLASANTKPGTDERSKAIAGLGLLQRKLRDGMELLGMAPGVQQVHVKILSGSLISAFKSKTQVMTPAQLEEMAEHLAELETLSGPGGAEYPLDPGDVRTLLGADADSVVVINEGGSQPNAAMLAWANELEIGNWFTLDHKSKLLKTQYVWRSERKQLHLFSAGNGKNYLLQARRLASYLQAGLLVPTEDETLTVRATRAALAKLGQDPKRLLST